MSKLLVWFGLLVAHVFSHVRGEFSDDRLSDRFYTKPALSFLRDYGGYYGLFDAFFDKPPVSFSGRNKSLEEDGFVVRNYSNFASWNNARHSDKPNPFATSDFFHKTKISPAMKLYNNRFRFGPSVDDRFLAIGLDADPWNAKRNKAGAINVHFVGVGDVLPRVNDYLCMFTHPLRVQSRVLVEEPLKAGEQPRVHVRCELPVEIVATIAKNDSITHITLDLRKQNNTVEHTLLSDISLFPTHPLDRRSFRFTVETMASTINHPMLVEWLVYNIMLGVEHFFIFVNRDITVDDVLKSPIRPFLDANIVSLVYFPYYHPRHFNQVQESALNTHLHMFSSYSEWVGYWDTDEFFLPSSAITDEFFSTREHHAASPSSSLLALVVDLLKDEQSSGIMFDSLEMGCDKKERGQHYKAHCLNCLRVGMLFVERKMGHGKMLIRPERVKYMASPHRLFATPVTWTDQDSGGLFRHFNGFRYSDRHVKNDLFDDTLRTTTKKMFEVMLNLKIFDYLNMEWSLLWTKCKC